jgi:hypothetical protein
VRPQSRSVTRLGISTLPCRRQQPPACGIADPPLRRHRPRHPLGNRHPGPASAPRRAADRRRAGALTPGSLRASGWQLLAIWGPDLAGFGHCGWEGWRFESLRARWKDQVIGTGPGPHLAPFPLGDPLRECRRSLPGVLARGVPPSDDACRVSREEALGRAGALRELNTIGRDRPALCRSTLAPSATGAYQ